MALPPKGDPSRPLFQAARAMCWLGGVVGLLGVCGLWTIVGELLPARARIQVVLAGIAAVVMFLGVIAPAMLHLVCGVALRARRRWAVTWGSVAAWAEVVFICLSVLGTVRRVIGGGGVNAAAMVLLFLWVVGLINVLGHLRQAAKYLDSAAPQTYGFEPIMASPPSPPSPPTSA